MRNGLVLDGLGHEPLRADIGVRDGRIACVGIMEAAEAQQVIDAAGQIVAPGFIDVHTHIEKNLPNGAAPFLAPNFARQGVTTIITGNCGRSVPSLAPMFEQLDRNGAQVNVASLIGHNTVRRQVMGAAARAPTPQELAAMEQLIARAMSAGALGLSTGLVYAPGMYARRDELIALTRVAAAQRGLYVTHLRDEGAQGMAAIQEALAIGAAANAPVHISHFKAQGRGQWGTAAARLALVDEARRKQMHVSIDQYPYTASSTGLEVLLPAGGESESSAQLRQSLRNPQMRARLRAAMLAQLQADGWPDYSFARVAYCPSNLAFNGLSINQIADRRLTRPAAPPHVTSAALKERATRTDEAQTPLASERALTEAERQADVILDLLAEGGAQMIYFDMDESDVAAIMKHDDTMFGSDSGVRLENAPAIPHPRGLGTFPRVLARYVREQQTLSLPDAVRRMTSLPAQTFGLGQRGQISAGYWADLVIFDAQHVADQATYEQPLAPPRGIAYTIVSGVVVLERGQLTTATPGRALRHQ